MTQKSHARGASMHPLLNETIGDNLRNTVNRFPKRDALISVDQQYKATYAEFWQ